MFPTRTSQGYIENAFSIRPKSAELLYAGVNVEEITFNRGYYTVDVTYFYRVTGECVPNAKTVTGLCVFNKRVILFGSEGGVKVYTSDGEITTQADQPVGVVEAVDPIALSMQITEKDCATPLDRIPEVPANILAAFPEELVLTDSNRLWYATLGQFSLIRLESATASSSSRSTTTASQKTSASARRTTIRARSSGASASRWRNFIRPTISQRATATGACSSNLYYARKRRNFVRSGAFRYLIREPGG